MQISTEINTLGKRLYYMRQTFHKTLQEVSNDTGVSRSNLGKYEKDIVKPSADAIISLCNFYDISADWLLKGIDMSLNSEIKQQKIGGLFDPDLKMMIDVLKELMESGDPDLRGWTKIQFKNAFKEHCAAYEDEKKLNA